MNRVPHDGGGVMVWAGRSYRKRTQLHFTDGNLNAQKSHGEIEALLLLKVCDQWMHICIFSHVKSID
jgi:hypothetical protein